jgi:hypothetical protein
MPDSSCANLTVQAIVAQKERSPTLWHSGDKVCHKNDILLRSGTNEYFAIECKFLSPVSDQFKARAYDMLKLKREFGDKVIRIMVIYAHVPGCGIGLQEAELFCYPFDHFVGFELGGPGRNL